MPNPASPPRFFCLVQDKATGPFDLIELAAEIRYGHINADTPVCREGTEDWRLLCDLPEFIAAQEVSIDTIARHLERKERTQYGAPSATVTSSFPWAIVLFVTIFLGLVIWAIVAAVTLPSTGRGFQPISVTEDLPSFAFAKQYRAETNLTTSAGKAISTIYKDNEKERVEITAKGSSMIVITRLDLKRMYQIWVDHKLVHQIVFSWDEYRERMKKSATGPDAKIEPIDREIFNNIPCIKYKVTADKHTWFLWVDAAKQAPLQLEEEGGASSIQFKSYETGPQPASVFEPPVDYTWR